MPVFAKNIRKFTMKNRKKSKITKFCEKLQKSSRRKMTPTLGHNCDPIKLENDSIKLENEGK
jgi:hypothetical protein